MLACDVYNHSSSIEWRSADWMCLERLGCDGRTELAVLVKGGKKNGFRPETSLPRGLRIAEHADGVTYISQLIGREERDERTQYLHIRCHQARYGIRETTR